MPLDKETGDRLLRTLAENGWSYRSDFIYAPNETMWLSVSQPWHGDLENLHETMVSRMEKVQRHKEAHKDQDEHEKILQDIGSLVSAIQQLVRRKQDESSIGPQ